MTITEKLRLAEEIEKRNRARIEAWKKAQKKIFTRNISATIDLALIIAYNISMLMKGG